ncbi:MULTISPECIES: spore germination protein GerPE [Mesobacillus]|uniref:spore germination protein GerPE n=1 Tax=Mesobacillus TaxID=2675231 RepID=UPI00178366B3|nr:MULTISPECIES: spore germination protein GerPE [Mesobacillus]MCM3573231.1 spore germination protein GerPE [Mesobacillus subterraneus]UYZ23147.1 spore germination protein GerPE [Mesobacillus jeotgali]
MLQRITCVDHIKIDSVSFSSIFQIGDSEQIQAISRALAVQREAEIFFDNEGNFDVFPIFSEPIPFQPTDEENVVFSTHNLNPVLKVRNIDILGASSSSVVHLGNSRNIAMEARVKHIRQLLPRNDKTNGTSGANGTNEEEN